MRLHVIPVYCEESHITHIQANCVYKPVTFQFRSQISCSNHHHHNNSVISVSQLEGQPPLQPTAKMHFTSILSAAALAIGSVQAGPVHDRSVVANGVADARCGGGATWSGWQQSCLCETGQIYQNNQCGYTALRQQNCAPNQSQFCAQDQSSYCAYGKLPFTLPILCGWTTMLIMTADPNHAYCQNNGRNIAFCSETQNVQETATSYWNMGVTVINN